MVLCSVLTYNSVLLVSQSCHLLVLIIVLLPEEAVVCSKFSRWREMMVIFLINLLLAHSIL